MIHIARIIIRASGPPARIPKIIRQLLWSGLTRLSSRAILTRIYLPYTARSGYGDQVRPGRFWPVCRQSSRPACL
jgi:hypothetical protein